jgi:Tfp pilus assembly protein PilW
MTSRGKHLLTGFTLVEMLMTLACSSIVLTALVLGGVALQHSFAALEGYSIAEGDQLRVSDYIAMDVRRALTASVDASNVLTITIPNYYDANNSNPKWSNAHSLAPSFDLNGAIQYGAGTTTVKYYKLASNFIREVNGTQNTIASNVSSFTVSPQDLTSSVSCSIMFFPTFTHMTGFGTWRSGGSAPSNTIGTDSDYYVIDTTASDVTTVGNVYFKSSGSYSLLQNVKATLVCSNTFLRNATARQ